MMDQKIKLQILVSLLLLGFTDAGAQRAADTLKVVMAARAMDDRIVLRWSPQNYDAWIYGNQYGYQVTRRTLTENGKPGGAKANRVILAGQLRPLPEAAWKALADTSNLAVVAAASLYSSTFEAPDAGNESENDTRANRFSFGLFAADQFLDIATGMALGFVDTTVVAGMVYEYTVTFSAMDTRHVFMPGVVTCSADQRTVLPPPSALTAQWQNRSVRLKWDRSQVDTLYTSYSVERSADGGATYIQINKSPLIYITPDGIYDPFMYYLDSLNNNENTYSYRIRGRTPFGEWGDYSAAVSGNGRRSPLTTPPGITGMEELPEQAGLSVLWTVDSAALGRISGFHLYELAEKNSPQKRVNPKLIASGARQFIAEQPIHGHYYQVGLVDDTGHELLSAAKLVILHDDQPPAPPIGLEAAMDTTGKAMMTWQSNPEQDLQGYRVYTGNHETGYFAELTYLPVSDTFYRQTYSMKTLHEAEFFKVRAIDVRGNYSEFSKPARIVRPDMHPPSPPAFTQVRADQKKVYLRWANSNSKDVARHVVERRMPGEKNWLSLMSLPVSYRDYAEWSDSTGIPGQPYQYRVVAVDRNERSAPSTTIQSRRIDDGHRGRIRNFSAQVDANGQTLLLSWQYDRLEETDRFLLYRSEAEAPPGMYKTLRFQTPGLRVEGDLVRFESAVDGNGKRFQYRLLAITNDGGYSDLSAPVFVTH